MDAGGSRILATRSWSPGGCPDERQADEAVIDEELAARRHLRGRLGLAGRRLHHCPARAGGLGDDHGRRRGQRWTCGSSGSSGIPSTSSGGHRAGQPVCETSGDLYLTPAYWRRYGRAPCPLRVHRGDHATGPGRPGPAGGATCGTASAGAPGVSGESWRWYRRQRRRGQPARACGGRWPWSRARCWSLPRWPRSPALLLVGQTLGRQIFLESVEYPTLRALGMTRASSLGWPWYGRLIIGGAGRRSPWSRRWRCRRWPRSGWPGGPSSDPGVAADLAVLAPGALAVFAVVAAAPAVAAWRASRSPVTALGVIEPARPGRRHGWPVRWPRLACRRPRSIGTRLALEPGRGRTAVPVRAAIAGAAAAVCALTAAGVFGASLTRLVERAGGLRLDLGRLGRQLPAAPTRPSGPQSVGRHPGGRRLSRGGHRGKLVRRTAGRVEVMAIERGKGPSRSGSWRVASRSDPARSRSAPPRCASSASASVTRSRWRRAAGQPLAPARRRPDGAERRPAGHRDRPGKGAVVDIEVFRRHQHRPGSAGLSRPSGSRR